MGKRASAPGDVRSIHRSARRFLSVYGTQEHAPLLVFVLNVGDTVWVVGGGEEVVQEVEVSGFRRTGKFRVCGRGGGAGACCG